MNHHAAMIQELQESGVDPTQPIDAKDWNRARLRVRSARQTVADGVSMVGARVTVPLRILTVSRERAEENLAKCRTNACGSYGTTKDGKDLCWRCNCSGRDLRNKVSIKGQKCPHDPPLWDNRSEG